MPDDELVQIHGSLTQRTTVWFHIRLSVRLIPETGIERIVDGVWATLWTSADVEAGIVEAQGVAVLADRSLAGLVEA